MSNSKWIWFLVVCIFFIEGCATYEPIKIQALTSAEVKISPKVYRMVLINHAFYRNINGNSESNTNPELDSVSSFQYFSGLLNSIGNSPRFQLVSYSPILIKKSYNERFQKLNWQTIEKICTDSSADAALVLENYQVSYTPVKLSFSREYGYYGSLQVINSSLWKIYVPANHEVVEDYFQKDTLLWDGSGYYASEVYEQIPEVTDAAVQSCYYAGTKYGKRIAQTWVTLNRLIINIENKDFITAAEFAKYGKWADAIALWKKYTYGKNKRLAAFSCYNMAIASETYDNIDAALEWAAKSYFLKNNVYTENYITILENRKKQKELINTQFE